MQHPQQIRHKRKMRFYYYYPQQYLTKGTVHLKITGHKIRPKASQHPKCIQFFTEIHAVQCLVVL